MYSASYCIRHYVTWLHRYTVWLNWGHIFSRKHLQCQQQQLIIDDADYLWTRNIMRLPIKSLFLIPQRFHCFLPFAATQTHFQDPESYISVWRICGLRKSHQKNIWFFKKYKKLNCQRQCQWQQLITGAAYVADWLFVTSYRGAGVKRSMWKNIHVLLMWNFVIHNFFILLLSLSPSLLLLLCTFPR